MNDVFEAEVLVDPDVPLVRVSRQFEAPRSRVFRAHTDPDLVVRWNGPDGTAMRIDHWDCRPGGSYRFRHVSDGGEYRFRGCFHHVRPDELIVQTFSFDDPPAGGSGGMADGVALERLVLDDLGHGRTRLTVTTVLDSFADRDAFLAGWVDGARASYQRLAAVLIELDHDGTSPR